MPFCEDCGVSVTRRSRWCRKCCRKHVSQTLKGRPKTEEHKRKIGAGHFNVPDPLHHAANHRNWKGGGPNWRGFAWRIQRRLAKERDGHKCCRCPATTGLSVHHIKRRHETGGEWDNRLENLETLCRSCHGKHHGAEVKEYLVLCRVCGTEYTAHGPGDGACSGDCRTKLRTANQQRWLDKRQPPFVCRQCGTEFPRRTGRSRYCSDACAATARADKVRGYNRNRRT